MYAAECGSTGYCEISVFHGLFAGKIVQPPTTGTDLCTAGAAKPFPAICKTPALPEHPVNTAAASAAAANRDICPPPSCVRTTLKHYSPPTGDYCVPSNRRRMIRGIVIGAVGVVVLGLIVIYTGIEAGLMPANADARPPGIERWAARPSLAATLRRDAPTTPNPVALNDANLEAGIKLYGQNCA